MKRWVFVTLLATVMLAVSSMPARATGIFVGDFRRFEADPKYSPFVEGYIEGLIEGIIVGLAMETRARAGDGTDIKALCLDPSDHYKAKDAVQDVRRYLSAHPETPDNWTVGTVMALILAERYRCR